MGTVCIRIKYKRDIDTLFDALGGESGLELVKDLTLGDADTMDLIDAQKTLMLVGKEAVDNAEQAREEIAKQHGLIGENGRFQKSVKLAFFNSAAVRSSVGSLADNIKQKDEEKKKKEKEDQEAEEARKEAEQDAKDIGNLSYYPSKRDWVVPDTIQPDARLEDERYVAGGSPKCLEASPANKISRDKTRPEWRPITKYMVGEADKLGNFKVYIEDPEVVNADKDNVKVEFRSQSYKVRVEVPGAEPLILGPVDCGQVDMRRSSWKVSAGKRMTISVVKADNGYRAGDPTNMAEMMAAKDREAAKAKEEKDKQGEQGGGYGQVLMSLVSILPVLASFWYFNYGSGSGR